MKKGLRQLNQPLSRTIRFNGSDYLYFGGTAYLGIPQNKDFRNWYIEGLDRYGINNGTSRSNNIQLAIYDEAEEYAAQYFGAEACLITSSGYLAAQLTVKKLTVNHPVIYAPATHPALWHQEPKSTGNFTDWTAKVVEEINNSHHQKWVLVSNALNNLFPEIYSFDFLSSIDSKKEVICIIDDSHGIGVLNQGKGIISSLAPLKNVNYIIVASMAKALGVDAGLVLGTKETINSLKETFEFLGASPPAAAGLYAFMNARDIYETEHRKLFERNDYLASQFKTEQDWSFSKDFPVFLSTAPNIEKRLYDHQILMSSFAYPDQYGDLINRVVLSSWHTEEDIEKLIKVVRH